METVTSKLDRLSAFLPLSEENVDAFLELVAEIVDMNEASSIRPLLMLVDEQCELSGVMDTVLRNLEEFPSDVYVPELLSILPAFCEKSPFWCENEIKKRLWSEKERRSFISKLPSASPETKACLRTVLSHIQVKTPRLADACAQALSRL